MGGRAEAIRPHNRECWEDPIITYETVLGLLDEAVLVGQRSAPDPEGVVWVS